jgi:hypothetical protein
MSNTPKPIHCGTGKLADPTPTSPSLAIGRIWLVSADATMGEPPCFSLGLEAEIGWPIRLGRVVGLDWKPSWAWPIGIVTFSFFYSN